MKVAIVTPYYKTPLTWLRQCHESVLAQSHSCTHFIVADGAPEDAVDAWSAQHIKLPVNAADYGDTPRGVGSVAAIAQGFEAIAYLDADNWYEPEHIASLVALQRRTGAAVLSSTRNLHRLDGSLLGSCFEVDGEHFVDTNCLFLTRPAFAVVQIWWMMEPRYHAIDDRVVWANVVRRNFSRAHSGMATVAYRTAFANHYRCFGEPPPPGAKSGMNIHKLLLEIGCKVAGDGSASLNL